MRPIFPVSVSIAIQIKGRTRAACACLPSPLLTTCFLRSHSAVGAQAGQHNAAATTTAARYASTPARSRAADDGWIPRDADAAAAAAATDDDDDDATAADGTNAADAAAAAAAAGLPWSTATPYLRPTGSPTATRRSGSHDARATPPATGLSRAGRRCPTTTADAHCTSEPAASAVAVKQIKLSHDH